MDGFEMNFIEQVYLNNKNYKGIIFVDRDGTINDDVNYLSDKSQIIIFPKVIEGIKLLNKYKIAVVVITNQPVVARGLLSIDELREINDLLVKKINAGGAFIEAIYSCPHHPENNHADIPAFAMKYRIDCDCRKPGTAMLKRAISIFGIKDKFGMIGDHERDVETAKNFGIRSALIQSKININLKKNQPDFICANFLDAVKELL